MKYISVKEAAERWELTPRRVQQFCKEGMIKKTQRQGRTWLIPENAEKPEITDKGETGRGHRRRPAIKPEPFMPLTASAFPLGKCEEHIKRFPENDQPLAWAEYYYFSGQAEKAAASAEPFLNHVSLKKKLSACIVYGFANLSLGHINSARFALNNVRETLMPLRNRKTDEPTKAICVYAATMGCVLLHLPDDGVPPLEEYTHRKVADELTTTEFTIAMLTDRGWTYKEIGEYMKLSTNTVGKYLTGVYRMLGISTKEELHSYMLY